MKIQNTIFNKTQIEKQQTANSCRPAKISCSNAQSPEDEYIDIDFSESQKTYNSALSEEEFEKGQKLLQTNDIESSKDGLISQTKQGQNTNDCWLLSAVNSLSFSNKGQEIIKNALEYNDGYTAVHFVFGDYTVSDEEIAASLASPMYCQGDSDMLILEFAIQKVRDDIASGDLSLDENASRLIFYAPLFEQTTLNNSSLNTGGYSKEALYYLTGQYPETCRGEENISKQLDNFAQNNNENCAMTAYIFPNGNDKKTVADINNKEYVLTDANNSHAVSVKNVDENTVTIVDPKNSQYEIILSRETFLENFTTVDYIELS